MYEKTALTKTDQSKVQRAVQLNHFSKYLKLLHAFNSDRTKKEQQQNIIKHKKNYSSYSAKTPNQQLKKMTKQKSISRSLTKNLSDQSQIKKQRNFQYKIPCLEFLNREDPKLFQKAKSTGILQKKKKQRQKQRQRQKQKEQSPLQIFLPSIKQKLHKAKQTSSNTTNKRHIKTLPQSQQIDGFRRQNIKKKNIQQKSIDKPKQSRLYCKKLEGTIRGNLLQFYRMKPTERYFSKLKNIQIAEKLLLAEPSKQLRKSQHKKFWNNQKSYRKQISRSQNLLMQTSRSKNVRSKLKRTQSQWID